MFYLHAKLLTYLLVQIDQCGLNRKNSTMPYGVSFARCFRRTGGPLARSCGALTRYFAKTYLLATNMS